LNRSDQDGAGAGADCAPPGTVECDVAAHAAVRVPQEAMAALRRQPGPPHGKPLAPAFLKHAEEQTVVGLAAVLNALHDFPPPGGWPEFHDWAVLAAPRFLGRPALGELLQRFIAGGAWEVSPHVIPHRSLHSVSGTVSQALQIHGPNFGVGGGPGGEAEILLTTLVLLQGMKVPGVWVVMTRLDPELPPDESGVPPPGSFCHALALAAVPAGTAAAGFRLRLTVAPQPGDFAATSNGASKFSQAGLADMLRQAGNGETSDAQLGAGVRVELSKLAAKASDDGPVLLPGPGLLRPASRPRRSA
jgi:hypothetical protein